MLFSAVKEGISPEPVGTNPMVGLLLIHVYVPPDGLLEKFVAVVKSPLQIEKLEGKITDGDGLTDMVKLLGFPIQPFTVGVTVMFEVIELLPLFIALKALMLPVPDEANPIVLSLFVHVNVPPLGLLVKVNPETLSPLHTTALAGKFKVDDA